MATFEPPLEGPQRLIVSAPFLPRVTAQTEAGEVEFPLRAEPGGWQGLFRADAPLKTLFLSSLSEVDPLQLCDVAAEGVPPWSRLRPDWVVGPLRFPAGHSVGDVQVVDPAQAALFGNGVEVSHSDSITVAHDHVLVRAGGALLVRLPQVLAPGQAVAEVIERHAPVPDRSRRGALRPHVISGDGRLVRLRRVAAGHYRAVFRVTERTDQLVILPRVNPGIAPMATIKVAPLDPLRRLRGAADHARAGLRVLFAPALRRAPSLHDLPHGARQSGARDVAIITATRDAPEHLARFLRTVQPALDAGVKLILVDNGTVDKGALALLDAAGEAGATVRSDPRPFNFAVLNNAGAALATRPILVFANNDIAFDGTAWLDALIAPLGDDTVGVTGARLLYPNRRVQHGGIVWCGDGHAEHIERSLSARDGGAGGRQRRSSDVAAVTGALLAIRAPLFHALGGFDPQLAVHMNDIDLCFRVRSVGRRVLFVGQSEAIHHESASIGIKRADNPFRRGGAHWTMMREREGAVMAARWPDADPCYPVDTDPDEGLFVPRRRSKG